MSTPHPPETDVTFTLNGAERTAAPGATLREVIAAEIGREVGDDGRLPGGQGTGVAAAVDGEVVPRARWVTTGVGGARIELVTATQGG
ncbi:sulfur carrier protein ThiS [Zhihengliuella flava]|uniref:Sulfur carrier protein n=1 Tax=Zhihengliuella flava TaxID=1285193 RepID=A0A931DCV2_9MICC|nr:sulfur carrier protein ThiS [Zhihengliuella flava]MBG6084435.1 sulfur carrier protein [Zhihengliuella flava]